MNRSWVAFSPSLPASWAIAKSSMAYSSVFDVAESPLPLSMKPALKYCCACARFVASAGSDCVFRIDASAALRS
ncbi:hypothetical protein GA0115255_100143 [Streptomyces sp. Ncost-T6T-2b]|nr:hypothetical protein GA0115255_100143 [Streptomyces sp. Ncost-T6T-2b]